jgi:hypothetical protein
MDDFQSLVSNFIESIIADNEHPRAALISTEGVVRTEDGVSEQLRSPGVVVVTNARLVFITPDAEMDLQQWSVYYWDVAEVTVDRETGNRVEVTTTDGVSWECRLPNANPEVLDAVTRHLRWVDDLRTRLLELETRIDAAADEIREHADSMDWDAATEVYREMRTDLDLLISDVQLTTPMADDTVAPELTDIERTLEEAHARLYIERGRSQLELGRYLVEHEDYDRAAEVLERARRLHLQAEGQSDAVKRADDFAFGRQRDLDEDLERLQWKLTEVAAEPVRQASEATVRARGTDDPTTAVEYWETAVRRYERILDLDWWKEAQEATEEIDDVRSECEQAVDRLLETHVEIADERWTEGVRSYERSDTPVAKDCFEAVVTHLERAHELAVEHGHDSRDDLAAQLAEVRETVENLPADSAPAADESSDDRPSDSQPSPGDDAGSEAGGGSTDSDGERGSPGTGTERSPTETETEGRETGSTDSETGTGSGSPEKKAGSGSPGTGAGSGSSGGEGGGGPPEREIGGGQHIGSDGDDSPETRPEQSGDAGPTAEQSTPDVRFEQVTFTDERRETLAAVGHDAVEWLPPASSDVVTVRRHHEPADELGAFDLPGGVPASDEDHTGGG